MSFRRSRRLTAIALVAVLLPSFTSYGAPSDTPSAANPGISTQVPPGVLDDEPSNADVQLAAQTTPSAAATVSYGSGGLEPLVPARLLDTREGNGAPVGEVGAGGVVELQVAGRGGVPAVGVGAVVLNVTAVGATAPSFVTVWPAGASMPVASNLNVMPGDTVPNLVIAKVGVGGKVSLFNLAGSMHLVADVAGWFPEGSGLEPLVPARLLDTREGNGAPVGEVGAGGVVELQVAGRGGVPAVGVGAVVLNVTAVGATAPSFVTVWPAGASMPVASNLNVMPGDTVPNLVIAKVGVGGKVSLFNLAGSMHLVADVAGWFPAGNASSTTMVLADGTVLAGSGDVVSYTGDADAGGTVTLSASADVPQVGGHLSVMPHVTVPLGFSGLVTALQVNPDGTVTVSLAPANLPDIFDDLQVSGAVDVAEQATTASVSNPATQREELAQLASCEIGGLSAPSLEFGGFGGDVDFDLRPLRARMVVTATATVTWPVGAGTSWSCSIETQPVLVASIGPLTFELAVLLSFSVNADIAFDVTASAPVTVGFNYENGIAENLSNVDLTGSATTGDISPGLEVSADVGIDALIDVRAGGLTGLEFSIGPHLTLSAGFNDDGFACVELVGSLVLGVAAEAGRWGVEWQADLANTVLASKTLYEDGCSLEWTGMISFEAAMESVSTVGTQVITQQSGTFGDLRVHSSSRQPNGDILYRLASDDLGVVQKVTVNAVYSCNGFDALRLRSIEEHQISGRSDSYGNLGIIGDVRITPSGAVSYHPYHLSFNGEKDWYGCEGFMYTGMQSASVASYILGGASPTPVGFLPDADPSDTGIAVNVTYGLGNPPMESYWLPYGVAAYSYTLTLDLQAAG